MAKRLLWSVTLAIATSIVLGLIQTTLPHSQIGGRITDLFAMPGAWLTSFIYPEGIHTGRGTSAFWVIWLTIISNLVVYALFWYAFLRVAEFFRRQRGGSISQRTTAGGKPLTR
jgi:hypothetical protein